MLRLEMIGEVAVARRQSVCEGESHMRISISPIFLSCLLVTNSTNAQTSDTTNYFPLTIGNSYVRYESSTTPPLPSTPTVFAGNVILRDTFQIDGRKYFYFPGLYYGNDTVSVPASGKVFYHYRGADQLYYNFAASVGESWQITLPFTSSLSLSLLVTLESRTDTVRITAGRFGNCLRFRFRGIGSSLEFTDWLAPGVGLVFHGSQFPWELHEAVVNGIKYPGMTSVEKEGSTLQFTLSQNYPNPFNPETMIEYRIATGGPVHLSVLDATGREVARLVDMIQYSGNYRVKWNGKNESSQLVSSGVYFCRLIVGSAAQTKKLVMIK
jgi:hypothetical protein